MNEHIFTDNGEIITQFAGGHSTIIATGSFGGGTYTVDFSHNKTDWTNLVSYTEKKEPIESVYLAAGFVRRKLTGATSPSLTTAI